ncbi:MAG TPA: addiction module antitoxin [Cyanobacteria bacterium UBA11149]|nr:addiction module antitoxin [Cyanobacteria bacterium UBA11367]HBE58683.1 addiction module antitoxin [Cyanobacteria bacterium UBA11366]HBR74548.1 addiction module antitoxin [Cyanobacteria bacterium UBA11159]HBS68565.1 addiction module antitoxin [Cyanobacteria bacterium UBA11153]HBW87549.1 addiction module antitoxin [Cyanobacteria bacterium UBA11149]HCA94607.1 addiction module antitoxin [Cyanobacteria bacterium UBA9226]
MTDLPIIEIRVTPEFQRKLRTLAKKYRQIQTDIQPILAQLQAGEQVGDKLTGIGADVFKARVRNSDAKRGKSGGYRLIYWIQLSTCIILIDIYSKSEQEKIEVAEIQRIIAAFEIT